MVTAFRSSYESGPRNAERKSAAENASAVSSAVSLFRGFATGDWLACTPIVKRSVASSSSPVKRSPSTTR